MFYDVHPADAQIAIERAKAVCAQCPVIDECREWIGLSLSPMVGPNVTAGMDLQEQVVYRQSRRHEREEIRARMPKRCGTVQGLRRHRELGEECSICEEAVKMLRRKHSVDA